MGIGAKSLELADLLHRSMLLGVNLGFNFHIKYNELTGEPINLILSKVNYREIGVVSGDTLEIYVPDGTIEIGTNAFTYDPYILNYRQVKVYLPDTCTTIRTYAFTFEMRPLLVYGENILYLDNYAFYNLPGGSVLNFPNLISVMVHKNSFYCNLEKNILFNFHDYTGAINDYMKRFNE